MKLLTKNVNSEGFFREFNKRAIKHRIPLSGTLDITHRCNLRCVHCYIGKPSNQRLRHKEMSTEQLMTIIDEIVEGGCLNLLITGGEPLLRRDFCEVYQYAKEKGLLVTVFTNGTMITNQNLELFEDLPPRAVEITLYGATVDTYERITCVKGSYIQCTRGIRQLLDRKIPVKLKTILMTHNRHEFFDIENMAKAWGVKFRFDAAIFPCLNGDKAPLKLRVPPEDAIEKEFTDKERSRQWEDFFERFQGIPSSDSLYQCGAGLTNFYIDPYGNLQPCLMVTNLKYNILKGNFLEGWHDIMPRIRETKTSAAYPCKQCEKRSLCGFCPAFFELENGSGTLYSEYLCSMGQLRYQAIRNRALS